MKDISKLKTSHLQADDHKADKNETVAQRQQRVEALSQQIIDIANNKTNSALRCIHMLNVAGMGTRATYKAIEQRIISDKDPYGAYHLALMAQGTSNLPVDARKLIEMVIQYGDNDQLIALLKNLPLPPVEMIKAKIEDSGDANAIERMSVYLQDNPEGYGSEVMLSSGHKDRIIPLNEAK